MAIVRRSVFESATKRSAVFSEYCPPEFVLTPPATSTYVYPPAWKAIAVGRDLGVESVMERREKVRVMGLYSSIVLSGVVPFTLDCPPMSHTFPVGSITAAWFILDDCMDAIRENVPLMGE
jgi:hypothetical protein